MCGILGIASHKPWPEAESWVESGLATMVHRGPDAMGVWTSSEKRVTYGHNRLSIIDLDERSNQPFKRLDLGLVITFNGELYNYRHLRGQLEQFGFEFETKSDTEVILVAYAKWGINCLKRFEGMFSFSIYDQSIDKVFLARDIVGEKPLFYYHNDGNLFFSSELKALIHDASLPRTLSLKNTARYLEFGFVAGSECIIEGYRKLPPGHYMVFDFSTVKVTRYWQLPSYVPKSQDTEPLLDKLDSILRRSISRMLIADVPLGILLSGGLDSSLIVAIASDMSDVKLHTYTVSFPEDSSLDEASHAQLIADFFNTNHKVLEVNPSTLIEMLPSICGYYDEPVIDSSMLPTWLVTAMVSKHCKVALGGDGGDELFGGYKHYSRLAFLKAFTFGIPLKFRRLIVAIASRLLPKSIKAIRYLEPWASDLNRYLPIIVRYFSAKEIKALLSAFDVELPSNNGTVPFGSESAGSLVEAATRRDFGNYLPEDILVKVDRASMSNSLEMRAPFLSKELIEFAFSDIPPEYKASKFDRKILLKKLARRYLPSDFNYERKQGFDIPIDNWMKRGELRNLFEKVMFEEDALFNSKSLNALIQHHDDGQHNGEKLFGLLQFQLWLARYDVKIKEKIGASIK